MYAKIFTQIFDSSIAENPELRFTFTDLLTLADQNGVVDMTHEAIARRTNRPLDVIRANIATLESPDLSSRTVEHEGRRIARLDEHRSWGWLICNYERFRMTASGEQQRAKTAARTRAYREKMTRKDQQSAICDAPVTVCDAPVTVGDACDAKEKEKEKDKDKQKDTNSAARKLAESIYEAYPRKVGRPVAVRAIEKALTTTDHETLLKATVAYAEARRGQDQQFTPMPATWFNQQRYNDDQATWSNAPAIKPKERNERIEHLTLTID